MKALVLESPGAIPKMAMLAMLAIVACTSATPASPTPVPTPTATSTPTPTPMATPTMPPYWPTLLDYKAVVLSKISSGSDLDAALSRYTQYAAVYVAFACRLDRELTPGGFRSFVDEMFWVKIDDGRYAIAAIAAGVIKDMTNLAEERIRLGLSPADRDCIRPYMYPESATEAILTIGLVTALSEYSDADMAPYFRQFALRGREDREKRLENDALRWFSLETGEVKPFLLWFCEPSTGRCLPTPTPSTPSLSTPPPMPNTEELMKKYGTPTPTPVGAR